jgi:hypothetical protein
VPVIETGIFQLNDVLIKYDILHMYACNYVEVRTCVSGRIDHIVRDIGAKASLSVYPPDRKAEQSAHRTHAHMKGIQTLAIAE